MKSRWKRIVLIILGVLLLRYGFFMSPLHHLRWVRSCPDQSLSPAEVEARYQEGKAATEEGRMGEYYLSTSILAGLPALREAAEHGHLEAMGEVRSHLMHAGIINVSSGPEFWRTQLGVAEEALMWFILDAHLGDEAPKSEEEKATFRILLDPKLPFPDGFFRSNSGTAWMFQMLSAGALDHARKQAYAWKGCWPEKKP